MRYLFVFLVIFNFSFSISIEKNIPESISLYVNSNSKSIIKESIPELGKYFANIFKNRGIDENILKILDKNYELVFNENNFLISKKMSMKDFETSPFFDKNKYIEKYKEIEYFCDMTQSIFLIYVEDSLLISDNINFIIEIIKNSNNIRNPLVKNKDYVRFLSKIKSFDYKYFLRYESDETLNRFSKYRIDYILGYSNKNSDNKIYITKKSFEYEQRTIDISKFINQAPDFVYLGRDYSVIFDYLEKDMKIFNFKVSDRLKSYFEDELPYFIIVSKADKFYIVILNLSSDITNENTEKILKLFQIEYENSIFYDRPLILSANPNYGSYYEFPRLGIKKCFGIIKDRNFVFSNSEDMMINLFSEKYVNKNFEKINISKEYKYNNNKLFYSVDFNKNIIIETIIK